MSGLDDLELNHSDYQPVRTEPPKRARWAIVFVTLLAIGGGLWYFAQLRNKASQATPPAAAPEQVVAPKQDVPSVVGADIALPPLREMDPLVRDLVGRLSSHSTVLAWLATKGLIENFVLVTLNISEGRTPAKYLKPLAPKGRFRTKGSRDVLLLDAQSYERYNGYGDAVAALDASETARLYATLKPRILDAYGELGHPEGDFDRVLERAIGELLQVPVITTDVALRPKVASNAFADPKLESLSAAQKQLLRMGPRNVQAVQAKLREIAAVLALHP